MELNKGFKQTEAGIIPNEWSTSPLGHHVQIKSGESPSLFLFSSDGVPYFKVEQLNNDNKYLQTTGYFINVNKSVPKGSLIFPKRGASILLNKIRILKKDSFMDTNLMAVTPDDSLHNEFLYYLFTHIQLWKIADTTSIPQINNKHIVPLVIPVPQTKREQEAIANALSDADAYIESLEKLIEKKRLIKKGVMSELLAPKKNWSETTLIDLCENKKELFDDGDWIEAEHITDSGVRLIQTGNVGIGQFLDRDERKYIFENSYISLKCKPLKAGDLLVCRLADPAGRACIMPKLEETKVITSVDVTICRPPENKIDRNFLVQLFSTKEWLKAVSDRSGGTTHKRISRGSLGKLKFKIPHFDEQKEIGKILSNLDSDILMSENKCQKAKLIKQGMMAELLTGRIRLV